MIKHYCDRCAKETDKKAFCSKCRTGNALKKAQAEGVLE